MNDYCKHKVHQFYGLFLAQYFDQDDVALFIVLTRDYAAKGSIIKELGDFLAHPDAKDRGIVLNSVKEAAANFEENCRRYFHDRNFNPPIFKGLGTLDELARDLGAIFLHADLKIQPIDRNNKSFRDFVFCTIFLLSTFKIKLGTKLFKMKAKYSHSLHLIISYESTNYPRHFVTLGVLLLGNVWIDCPTPFGPPEYELKNHIARRLKEGFLAAISYEDDCAKKTFSSSEFERGKIWPLPFNH